MRSDRLKTALASWPAWSATKPSVIRELKGGLTNQSYLLQAGGKRLVLRLNADNTNDLGLDRALEIQVLQRASAAGVAPALVYSDQPRDILITKYHDGHRWEDNHSSDPNKLQQLAKLLKTTHGLPAVNGNLDLQQRADHYRLSMNKAGTANGPLSQSIRALQQPLQEFFTHASKQCTHRTLCHNDLLAENLLTGNDAELIALDWEYAAMGDPYFDLAVVVEGHQMDDALVQILLENYTIERINAALQRLASLRVIYCYLDLLWHLVQSGAQNQAMLESKFERLRKLASA